MAITRELLLERVEGVLPGIAERAREAESSRRPHPDSINDLIDCEVMQALVPQRFGGHELPLDTITAVARAVSSACMSTGWVTAFYLGHNWMLTKFSEQVQQEVFAERPFGLIPIQPSPNLTVEAVDGGFLFSGRSHFSSGVMNADWVILSKAGGGPDALAAVVPIEDVTVDDVWHMAGMAATGSNDVIADKVFVPTHRTLHGRQLFESTESIHANPMYAIPLLPFIYCEVMGVYVGGLEGATAAYEQHVRNKVTTWGGEELAGKQAMHIALGEARARASAAGTLLDALVARTTAIAEQRAFTLETRLELKMQAGFIANLCRQSINDMMSRSGTNNFHLDQPIQRFFRDLNMLSTHAFIHHESAYELFGRHVLGLEPNSVLI